MKMKLIVLSVFMIMITTFLFSGCNGEQVANKIDIHNTVPLENAVINTEKTEKASSSTSNKINISKVSIDDNLCLPNEEMLLSFKIKKSSKRLTICSSKQSNYLVYRFGTKENIELEYPKDKRDSWDKFAYYFYFRGGGKQNLGLDLNYLSFASGNYIYQVYDLYSAENESKEVGIAVLDKTSHKGPNVQNKYYSDDTPYKEIDIEGDPKSIIGSLIDLRNKNLKTVLESEK